MAGIDINRTTSGVNLPPEVSSEIWGNTTEASVVMQATRQIRLPGSGVSVPSVTGEPVAQWTGETESKPVSRATVGSKTITPYKLAVIEPFSTEFRRDLPGLYQELVRRLPFALAKAFDATVFGAIPAPGANFDQLSATTTSQAVNGTDTIKKLAGVYQKATAAGGDVSAWLATPSLAGFLIEAQAGTTGFDLSSGLQIGSVFGAPVLRTRAGMPSGTIGYAGDFQGDAVWGSVEGVQIAISDQASLVEEIEGAEGPEERTINLWQQNMFAVRAEIEVGFRTSDTDRFVKVTGS